MIEKLSKFTGDHHAFLTPGEYTQLTGRAGRRGIDDLGHAVVLWSPFVPFDQVAALASSRSFHLNSAFRPTYNMAANLVRSYTSEQAHHLLNLSFAQYQADREVVRLETRLERVQAQLGELRRPRSARTATSGTYRRSLDEIRSRGAGSRRPRVDRDGAAASRRGRVRVEGPVPGARRCRRQRPSQGRDAPDHGDAARRPAVADARGLRRRPPADRHRARCRRCSTRTARSTARRWRGR